MKKPPLIYTESLLTQKHWVQHLWVPWHDLGSLIDPPPVTSRLENIARWYWCVSMSDTLAMAPSPIQAQSTRYSDYLTWALFIRTWLQQTSSVNRNFKYEDYRGFLRRFLKESGRKLIILSILLGFQLCELFFLVWTATVSSECFYENVSNFSFWYMQRNGLQMLIYMISRARICKSVTVSFESFYDNILIFFLYMQRMMISKTTILCLQILFFQFFSYEYLQINDWMIIIKAQKFTNSKNFTLCYY